jgi:hypothetical protein
VSPLTIFPALVVSFFPDHVGLVAPATLSKSEAPPPPLQDFRICPVLAPQYFPRHADGKLGGLRLDSKEGAANAVVSAIRQTGELKMPKGAAPLSNAQVVDITHSSVRSAQRPLDRHTGRGNA